MNRVAIVSAMQQELHALLALVDVERVERRAGRECHLGRLDGHDVVLALSGIGKVAAATTTAVLLDSLQVDVLLFTGVAGGLGADVKVGDVVIARELLQHDMDASPLFPRFQVPLTGRSHFAADAALSSALARGGADVLGASHAGRRGFGIDAPQLHEGLVISGDRFVALAADALALRAALPAALAVEMEGAAIAQVCADFARPFAVLRTVSDRADEGAHLDFTRFIDEVAAEYSRDIVRATLARL